MIYDENDKILKLYFLSAGGRERLLIIVSISKQFHSDIENIWSKCFNLNTIVFLFARVRIVGCSGGVESVAAPPPTLNCRQENINRQIVFPGRGQLPDHWAIFHREMWYLFVSNIYICIFISLTAPGWFIVCHTKPPWRPRLDTSPSPSHCINRPVLFWLLWWPVNEFYTGWRLAVFCNNQFWSEEWGVRSTVEWCVRHWGGQEGSRWCVVSVPVRTPAGQHTPLPALHCKHSNIF